VPAGMTGSIFNRVLEKDVLAANITGAAMAKETPDRDVRRETNFIILMGSYRLRRCVHQHSKLS
jgi:hypothetical protein